MSVLTSECTVDKLGASRAHLNLANLESATTLILFRGFTNRVVAYRGTIINVDRQAGVAAPYAFVVLSLLISLLGIGTGIEAPKDIYPSIHTSWLSRPARIFLGVLLARRTASFGNER
jgi:hypothetical protein